MRRRLALLLALLLLLFALAAPRPTLASRRPVVQRQAGSGPVDSLSPSIAAGITGES